MLRKSVHDPSNARRKMRLRSVMIVTAPLLMIIVAVAGVSGALLRDREDLILRTSIANTPRVGDPVMVNAVFVNRGRTDRRITVPGTSRAGVLAWFRFHVESHLDREGKTLRPIVIGEFKQLVDRSRTIRLSPGESRRIELDLRDFFVFPDDEAGNYSLSLTANQVTARPLRFAIAPQASVLLRSEVAYDRKIYGFGTEAQFLRSREFIVQAARSGEKREYRILSRFAGRTYELMARTDSKPLDLEVAKLSEWPQADRNLIVAWVSRQGFHYLDPHKLRQLPIERPELVKMRGAIEIESSTVLPARRGDEFYTDMRFRVRTRRGKQPVYLRLLYYATVRINEAQFKATRALIEAEEAQSAP